MLLKIFSNWPNFQVDDAEQTHIAYQIRSCWKCKTTDMRIFVSRTHYKTNYCFIGCFKYLFFSHWICKTVFSWVDLYLFVSFDVWRISFIPIKHSSSRIQDKWSGTYGINWDHNNVLKGGTSSNICHEVMLLEEWNGWYVRYRCIPTFLFSEWSEKECLHHECRFPSPCFIKDPYWYRRNPCIAWMHELLEG